MILLFIYSNAAATVGILGKLPSFFLALTFIHPERRAHLKT